MSKDEKIRELLRAIADGATVIGMSGGQRKLLNFSYLATENYEVIKKPRILYLNRYPSGWGKPRETRQASDRISSSERIECIKFIEVLESE